ncbi:MAG TPA: SpoIIE family protein phosphatase [Thermoanaerobaculia bacterium]
MNRLLPLCIAALLLTACARGPELALLHDDWMSATLPAAPYEHLVFRAYVDDFTLAVDGKPIYSYRDAGSRGRLSLHVVPLPRGGRQLSVVVPDAAQRTRFGADAVLATDATLPYALLHVWRKPLYDDAGQILLGMLFIGVGIVAFLIAAVRRRDGVLAVAGMGAFTLLYGARLIVESILPLLVDASVIRLEYVDAFLTYVIPIPGWFVPMLLIGRGWSGSLRWQVIAFAIFAPIGIASDLITRTPASLEQANSVLVILGGLNILVNLVKARARATTELRVVLAGSVIFLLFALNSNLSSLGLLPWHGDVEAIGFLVFVGCLGFASTRAFARSEREQLAVEPELRPAREIQLSILPTSMPDVAGLRVQTGYDPATSVAGDLYDFLRADATHLGVLVADVAGHGVPAALIASMVKIAAKSQARIAHDPAALLGELNVLLRTDVRRAFVTATYLWFDMERREVSVCNGGHPSPLLIRDGEVHELGGHGVLLGRFGAARYESSTTALHAGDRIVAFTDGIVEARNARDEQFGDERLKEAIARGSASDVLAAVHRWRVEDDADDLTIVVIDVA